MGTATPRWHPQVAHEASTHRSIAGVRRHVGGADARDMAPTLASLHAHKQCFEVVKRPALRPHQTLCSERSGAHLKLQGIRRIFQRSERCYTLREHPHPASICPQHIIRALTMAHSSRSTFEHEQNAPELASCVMFLAHACDTHRHVRTRRKPRHAQRAVDAERWQAG